jgi:hypothetical protein
MLLRVVSGDSATPDGPVDGDRPPAALVFQLGPRAHWDPSHSALFVAAAGFVPAILLAVLLRPLHPMIGIAIGMSLAVVAAVWPTVRVTVGVDGVSIGRRFHGYDQIERVAGEDKGRGIAGLVITLRDGARVELHCVVAQCRQILAHVALARERFERMRRDLDTSLLERRARPPAEWVRDLRAIGAGARVDHRTPPVPAEALWTAVESIGADPGVRAAAAVALRDSLDSAGRRRLQELAGTTASPRLRVALEAVVEEREDSAVAEALAAAEAQDGEVGRLRVR